MSSRAVCVFFQVYWIAIGYKNQNLIWKPPLQLHNRVAIEPYRDYCEHCEFLYPPVLDTFGLECEIDMSQCDHAKCSIVVPPPKKRWYKSEWMGITTWASHLHAFWMQLDFVNQIVFLAGIIFMFRMVLVLNLRSNGKNSKIFYPMSYLVTIMI